MATDRFRASLPSASVRILPESEQEIILLTEDNKRADGRDLNLFRPICLETGSISRTSGSSYAEYQNSKVICSVSGPRPIGGGESFNDIGILHCHFKYSPFSRKDCRKSYLADDEEKELSVIMEEALSSCICLEKYPKSKFDCYIMVLEDDGSILPAAITAASLAFADAGIEMLDLVVSCSSALLQGKGDQMSIVLDPNWEEQSRALGLLTLVYAPSLSSITHLLQTGYFNGNQLAEAIELTQDGCGKLYQISRNALISRNK